MQRLLGRLRSWCRGGGWQLLAAPTPTSAATHQRRMIQGARRNDVGLVQGACEALMASGDVDDIISTANTAMHVAAANGCADVVDYLCSLPPQCRIHVWSEERSRTQPVALAVAGGHVAVVLLLCRRWWQSEAPTCRYIMNPLQPSPQLYAAFTAAAHGRVGVLRELGRVPAVNAAVEAPWTCIPMWSEVLHSAARHGQLAAVRFLVEDLPPSHGVRVTCGWGDVGSAARGDHVEIVQYLCARAAATVCGAGNARSLVHLQSRALVWAAESGRSQTVARLCALPASRGVNPSFGESAALREAAMRGHVATVRVLCQLPAMRGVDPAAWDNFAVKSAAHWGHLAVVRFLCELPSYRGVRVTSHGHYSRKFRHTRIDDALVGAAFHGHLPVVKYLCALPPTFSAMRWLPVAVAAARHQGHEAVAQWLQQEAQGDEEEEEAAAWVPCVMTEDDDGRLMDRRFVASYGSETGHVMFERRDQAVVLCDMRCTAFTDDDNYGYKWGNSLLSDDDSCYGCELAGPPDQEGGKQEPETCDTDTSARERVSEETCAPQVCRRRITARAAAASH